LKAFIVNNAFKRALTNAKFEDLLFLLFVLIILSFLFKERIKKNITGYDAKIINVKLKLSIARIERAKSKKGNHL